MQTTTPTLEQLLEDERHFIEFVSSTAPGAILGSRGCSGETPIEIYLRRKGHPNARLARQVNGRPMVESGRERIPLPRWATFLIDDVDAGGKHGDPVLAWECKKIMAYWQRCHIAARGVAA